MGLAQLILEHHTQVAVVVGLMAAERQGQADLAAAVMDQILAPRQEAQLARLTQEAAVVVAALRLQTQILLAARAALAL